MKFNFGGFLSGMSQSIVSSIEEEEKQQRRFELMAEEDAMKQRAARKAERDKRQRVLEESIGALTSLGYSPEAAAQIAKGGSTSVSIAKDIGIEALKTGHDVDTFYRTAGVSDNMLEARDEINATIEAGGGRTGFQPSAISKMYAEPTETQNSFAATAAYLSQKMADTGLSEDERKDLERKFQNNLDNYSKWSAANPSTESPLFDPSKAERAVNAVQARKLNELKIDTDINTAVSRRLDGDEGRYGVGLLRAADELQATYGKFQDPIMTDKISYLRNDAVVNLKQYANNVVYRSSQDTGYKGTNLKQEQDVGAVEAGLGQSKYRIGDVVTYTDDNGAMRIIVYTGIPMNEAGDRFMFVK